MIKYFPQNNFEPFAYSQLNRLIDKYKKALDLPKSEKEYVVFDCDDTIIYSDIEQELLLYMLKNVLFELPPQRLEEILSCGTYDYTKPLSDVDPAYTGENFVADIVEAYNYLYTHYISIHTESRPDLAEIQETEEYKNFVVKSFVYYCLLWNEISEARTSGSPWPRTFFADLTRSEIINLTRQMIDHSLRQPIKREVCRSSDSQVGKTGPIAVEIRTMLNLTTELYSLFQALQDNGISTYVVSGSPIEMVGTLASHYLNVPYGNVMSMRYRYEDGQLKEFVSLNSPATYNAGKTEVIRQHIAPLHGGRDPIAVFGDSGGDYWMMTEFEDMELGFYFNRNLADRSQKIVDQAIETYGSNQAKYVMQGCNENTGELIPNVATIPFGKTEPLLREKVWVDQSEYFNFYDGEMR